MVMVVGRNGIDADAGGSKPRGDHGEEADSIESRIDIERNHACREFALDAVFLSLVERHSECSPFVFNKIEKRRKPDRIRHTIRYGAEAELAISEDWLRVGEKYREVSCSCFHGARFRSGSVAVCTSGEYECFWTLKLDLHEGHRHLGTVHDIMLDAGGSVVGLSR